MLRHRCSLARSVSSVRRRCATSSSSSAVRAATRRSSSAFASAQRRFSTLPFADLVLEAAVRVLELRHARKRQRLRHHPPHRGRGEDRYYRGEEFDHTVQPIGRVPKRHHIHEMGGAARQDKRTRERKDAAERQIPAPGDEIDQGEWDGIVRDRDHRIRDYMQPQASAGPRPGRTRAE